MKAVIPVVPQELLDWRKRTGAERWDEMWDGELHMGPTPNRDHQEFEWAFETWLRIHWARPRKARVLHQINLCPPGGWDKNYRIPDLVLISRERLSIDKNEYLEGAPDAVVEIHSPGDEAYEKLGFYADLGVPEVWIIHRDTKQPEIRALSGGLYTLKTPGADGWHESAQTGVSLKPGRPGRLLVRLRSDESGSLEEIPELD